MQLVIYRFCAAAAAAVMLVSGRGGQKKPQNPNNLIRLWNQKRVEARTAGEAGDWNKAIAVLQEATALDASRDIIWAQLGEAYRKAAKYPEAEAAYNRAIAIKPSGPYYNNFAE